MACNPREPAEVDGVGRRLGVKEEAQLGAAQQDRAVDGERKPVCKLEADDGTAKGSGRNAKSQCQEGMETTSGWGRKDPAEKRTKSPIQQRGSVRCRRLPSEIPWLLVCNRFVGGGNAKRMGMRVGSWERG